MLARLGISELSEMQKNADEVIRNNDNVVLLAPTGTGKTLAFLLPLLEGVKDTEEVQALILSPTRELANQTYEVLGGLKSGLRGICLHGGRPAMEEHRVMNASKPQIVVGTPGRVNDHLDKENFNSNSIRILVIDEFDKMLELKFQDELSRIVSRLTNVKRTILVSATNAKEIPDFMDLSKHPVTLNYLGEGNAALPSSIRHFVVRSTQKDKLEALRLLLGKIEDEQAVVFVGYRESVERVGGFLREQGFVCSLFHGGLEQEDREKALYMFMAGAANILVSTDLSARGLDIPTLANVIHYHLPARAEDYMHRCGRTGRWERSGNSFILLGPEEKIPEFANVEFMDYPLEPPFAAPKVPLWAMLYIGKGKRDKLSKGDIVGFLCKQGGARAQEIGSIDVRERYSYVSVLRSKSRQILKQCTGEKIKKMSTKVELMKD